MFRFTLTYNSVSTEVDEPNGWTEFKSELNRDFKSHGVMFKYTSGTLKLGFADGRDVLEDAFRLEGFDAVVTLTVEERADATQPWTTVYTGTAVMRNRELSVDYFEVDFESSAFQQKIINRLDTKVRLDATVDLDGNALTGAITSYTGNWNDIRLKVKHRADYRPGGASPLFQGYNNSNTETDGTNVFSHFMVDFTGMIEEKILNKIDITESANDGQLANDSGDHIFIIGSPNPGDLTLTGTFKYQYSGTITTTSTGNLDVNLRWYLRHENGSGTLQSQSQVFIKTLTTDGTSPYNYDSGVLTASFTNTTITGFNAGDRVLLYMETEAEIDGVFSITDNVTINVYNSSRANFTILIEDDTNSVKHYLTHDLLEWVMYILTGNSSGLQSTFFGLTDHGYASDGCGGLTAITNGSHLRGINDPIEISLKEILDSLNAIYGTGYSFENDGAGNYSLRVELMEYFYSDNEILDLGTPITREVDTYRESTFDDLVFNKVEIGYGKYANDEDYNGDIDDFLTRSEYALPISTITGLYSKVCTLITSGRLIQSTYQAKEDLAKAWRYDNDNFFVCVVRSASTFIPENDENFQTLAGFSNSASDTAYNLRIAPVYMFLNHALIVNSALLGKPLDSTIVNTSTQINKSFSALFDSTEGCLLGDVQRLTRTSVGNIDVGNNYVGYRLFAPVTHELIVAMTKTQLDLIIDNMENNGANNYGYLTYRDNDDNLQYGYLLNATWNPIDEIATITTIEKADNYGI